MTSSVLSLIRALFFWNYICLCLQFTRIPRCSLARMCLSADLVCCIGVLPFYATWQYQCHSFIMYNENSCRQAYFRAHMCRQLLLQNFAKFSMVLCCNLFLQWHQIYEAYGINWYFSICDGSYPLMNYCIAIFVCMRKQYKN